MTLYALALSLSIASLLAANTPIMAQSDTCAIYGQVFKPDGRTPCDSTTRLYVTRADKSGRLYGGSVSYKCTPQGYIRFTATRTSGTDTSWIQLKGDIYGMQQGVTIYVPNASTAELRTLVSSVKPPFVIVAVAASGADSLQTLFDPAGTQKIPSSRVDGGSATDQTARDIANGKAGADSVHSALLTLSNLIAGKASADSIHTQIVTLYNLIAGKGSADSIHTAISAMLKMSDTTLLHAQRFALINDSLAAVSLRATTALNTITAHAARTDNPHAVTAAQVGALALADTSNLHAQKFAVIDTALSKRVITETDPTATAKAQVVVTDTLNKWPRNGKMVVNGNVDSLNSTGRIYVSDDSITFTVSPSDVVNCALGNVFRGTIGRNDTLSLSNMVDGQIVSVAVTNAGTYTLAWSGVNWAGGTPPTLSATANKRDVFTFIRTGGIVYGSAVQDLR